VTNHRKRAYSGGAAAVLLNNRMAYVAISRGAHDAQLFTNDRENYRWRWAMMFPIKVPMRRRSLPRSPCSRIAPNQEHSYEHGISL
jgi:hypothetical protein